MNLYDYILIYRGFRNADMNESVTAKEVLEMYQNTIYDVRTTKSYITLIEDFRKKYIYDGRYSKIYLDLQVYLNELESIQHAILGFIESIQDELTRAVIYSKYIEFKSYDVIADEQFYCYNTVRNRANAVIKQPYLVN